MTKKCPKCGSIKTIKKGVLRGVQTYKCKECNKKFSAKRRNKISLIKQLWKEYVFNKQTIRELKESYNLDKRRIKEFLNQYESPKKIHNSRKINLVVDGTYFGERIEDSAWCTVVGRCQYAKEDLWWSFPNNETTSVYKNMRTDLESLGYIIKSVTGDGFGGIRKAFNGIPYQMCHVHMERIVTRGTTKKPQTEAGQILLAITKTLKDTEQEIFKKRLKMFIERYREFLNEKTIHPISKEWSWTHEGVRSALKSLVYFEPFLFTYEHNKKIPKTSNSLEGHFRHIKRVVNVHCGLSRAQKEKVLHSIFLAGTVAPSEDVLGEIL